MRTRNFGSSPWLSLALVLLSYGLWGWYISAYSLIWLGIGWLVAILISFTTIWTSRSIGSLMRLGPRSVLTMLFLSLIVTTAIAAFSLFSIIVVLTLAQVLARFELRTRGLRRIVTLEILSVVTTLGLAIGWSIGKFLYPSDRFWLILFSS